MKSRLNVVPIRAVVIGVPAHNEVERVAASVTSMLEAVDALGPGIDAHLTVAADRCSDGTEDVIAAIAANHSQVHVVAGCWGTAGGARRAAIARGLAAMTSADTRRLDEVWIATTDADTVVTIDWLQRQMSYANTGFDAVAGVVELLDDADRSPAIAGHFALHYAFDEINSHSHVHGANLGVRATAYLAAGGFPDVACSEDHALWNELLRLGRPCASPIDVRVLTSARLDGRAIGGFADTLAEAMR